MSGEVETTVIRQEDLKQGLTQRHVMMIAIGGAIGVGLFLGAGRAIQQAGPALIAVYAITGVFIFVIMRALGELLLYKPVSGSFAEYAKEFFGPMYGFITGWGYWFTWTVIGMAELTAAGKYINFWFPSIPQYLTALVFLVLLVVLNLAAVGAFGEAEFWFASIKVLTILVLVVGGTAAMIFSIGRAGQQGTIVNLWDHGGAAPNGLFAILLTFQIVVFAYQGVELVGMTAAECKNREKVLPRAVNSIPARIMVFYVGSLLVLLSLFPWTEFSKDTSPFVQAFAQIGVPAAGALMNFVVLTAALSSCSSGLYSNGRLLHRLAKDGLAPTKAGKISRTGVPAVGVLASGAVMLVGVGVNYVVPEKAFAYITSVATLGAIWSWGIIVASHLVYRRRVARGEARPSPFRLPMATAACWAVLGFLAFVTVILAFDEDNRVALYSIPIWAVILGGGYLLFGKRGMQRAEMERTRHTVG